MEPIYDKNDVLVYVNRDGVLCFLLVTGYDTERLPYETVILQEITYEEATASKQYKLKTIERLPSNYHWIKK